MAHGHALHIDLEAAKDAAPIQPNKNLRKLFWGYIFAGLLVSMLGIFKYPQEQFWGAYYVNLLFWMGLSVGGVVITAIWQIVRATWSPAIRRLAEANVSFLPWAYLLVLISYFGKNALFPWGDSPMPGREWWMQPAFVYGRFAVLLAILFGFMWCFVRLSLRSDFGMLREDNVRHKHWTGFLAVGLSKNWKGSTTEIPAIQRKLSYMAPVLIALYAVCYSLFAFEMVMSMDAIWYSNLFGAFLFIGNIYMGLAMLALLTIYFSFTHVDYAKTLSRSLLWDLGKLTFAFCMIWGYFFFSQYLPQWYGNMPEETQWLILRTKGLWRPLSYCVFAMCFVIPFILLLSEDLKKTPGALGTVCIIILIGMWLQFYVLVMPQLVPESITLFNAAILEVGLFFGFMGVYGLAIQNFMSQVPFIPVSHPATVGSVDW